MISKHDLLKRLWAFVHSHLIPTLVCSVGAQQTSFRICSTDLCVIERMGENIKQNKKDDLRLNGRNEPINKYTTEEGINTVRTAYENSYNDRPPIPICAY